MQALVTGATGFLGSHIARRLLDEDWDVRALVRPTSDLSLLDDLDVETVTGDVTDATTLPPAVEACDVVFHAAGVVSFWSGWQDRLEAVNVDGVRNVVEAAVDADVDRLVHTSSVAAVGLPEDGVADESRFAEAATSNPYVRTKLAGERIVADAAKQGRLDAVVVNPGTVLGPGDVNKNGGQVVRAVVRGDFPGPPDGGTNFVDVRDVADGHLAAHEKGRTGQRYILGGDNLTYGEMFDVVGEAAGIDPPSGAFPYVAALAVAAIGELRGHLSGRHPPMPIATARALFEDAYYSSKKARSELGYDPRPIQEAVQDTVDWYRDRGML